MATTQINTRHAAGTKENNQEHNIGHNTRHAAKWQSLNFSLNSRRLRTHAANLQPKS